MDAWLRSFHPSIFSAFLERFDFLTTTGSCKRAKSNTIVFAGNLQKVGFWKNFMYGFKKTALCVSIYMVRIFKNRC